VARALKVFKTHIGFYDLVVATPSMKAAAEAWGSKPTIFAQGFAAVTQDADAVQAALANPGQVLKRPHGQPGPYKAEPDALPVPKVSARQKQSAKKAQAMRKRQEAAAARAAKAADRKATEAAKDELAEIEQEEAALRDRRQSLQKKFHIRSVK
jgi:colicin import membrane protein